MLKHKYINYNNNDISIKFINIIIKRNLKKYIGLIFIIIHKKCNNQHRKFYKVLNFLVY